jgi:hypothetical protein
MSARRSFTPPWFLHYGFGTTTHSTPFFVTRTYTTSFRHDVSVVRLGINYRP